jgi:glycosyltransferase involved in cell wall biosynthesis
MKICFVGDASSIHINRWTQWFSKRGHEVHLISDKPEDIEGVKVHRLNERAGALAFFLKIFQTRKIIKRIRPDLVHGHYLTSYGAWAASSDCHPSIVTAWGSDVLIDTKIKTKRRAVKYALRNADIITCAGEYMKQAIISLGAEEGKIIFNYFGIDTQAFDPALRSEGLRNELGVSDSPLIISTRRLEPIYDVGTLIRAVPSVIQTNPNARFVIVGDGSERGKLMSLADSLKISVNVTFVGWIQKEKLPGYLASANIYVNTSLSDSGLAVSTREAMACGLPVITTDLEANRGWGLEDGKSGYLVPIKDPKALAARINLLLRDKEIRMKFGEINRDIAAARYDFNEDMGNMENLYKEHINIAE